ncbi:MAG TPA: hypothetical protein VM686_00385 [Polyangiaceae bacterium]|nr:hypothetical protein [Polyangiaceae bacterium]
MAKSYGDKTNQRLRKVLADLVETRFEKRGKAASALGVSAAFVSDFLGENRGAGLDLLKGLARYAPLEVIAALEIDLPTVLNLAVRDGARGAVGEAGADEMSERLPGPVVRAMKAAIELTGCTPSDAYKAACEAVEEYGQIEGSDADWWLAKVRDRIPKRSQSGTRPSVRLRAAKKA